jgi:hypothetical protein
MKNLNVTVETTIKGIRPLIMHNGRTTDPIDPYSRAKAKLKATKKKITPEQFEESMAAIEFEAALYWSDTIGLYLPSDNLQRMLLDGAKRFKLGRSMSAVIVDEEFGAPIITRGHDSLDELKANKSLWFRKACRIQQSKVMVTRPMIPTGWTCTFKLSIDTEFIETENVQEILTVAGRKVGLGDWRPGAPSVPGSFGMFIVEAFNRL